MAKSLNKILYGPPGTGKTYNVIKRAVEICDGNADGDYKKVLQRYNELKEEGRIAFVTFHQSYGYEDFIEGIRPVLDKDNKELRYELKDGMFKEFCENSTSKKFWILNASDTESDSEDYKYSNWFKESVIKLSRNAGSGQGAIQKMKKGDYAVLLDRHTDKHLAVGLCRISTDKPVDTGVLYKHDVKWIWTASENEKGVDLINELTDNKTISYTDYICNNPIDLKRVFIIDEINRGNISKIFGELITLIEEDKRKGADNEMEAVLPYSRETFSVPKNVYILGTMNTADRSIALMDTALRRRFSFEEMMPKPELFEGTEVDGVKINELLEKMNQRIEVLLDREHQIGHAYFMPLKTENSLKKLQEIFKDRIIPLLQEYFYDDYEKIKMVLNDTDNKFIRKEKAEDKFGYTSDDVELPDAVYTVGNSSDWNEDAFQNIY